MAVESTLPSLSWRSCDWIAYSIIRSANALPSVTVEFVGIVMEIRCTPGVDGAMIVLNPREGGDGDALVIGGEPAAPITSGSGGGGALSLTPASISTSITFKASAAAGATCLARIDASSPQAGDWACNPSDVRPAQPPFPPGQTV